MSEEKKEVEVKVYLSTLDNVLKFVKCFDLERVFTQLNEHKEALLLRPCKEQLDNYIQASTLFFELNGNLISLVDAYLEAKREQEKG